MVSRSRWQNQFTTIHASKFHLSVKKVFVEDSFFSQLSCYQEVPVADICPDYPHASHRFDWYIEDLGVVIELHGQQHYKMTNRGGLGYEEAVKQFKAQQHRDQMKREAALKSGFSYIEIPWKDRKKITAPFLKNLIFE